MMWSDLLKPRTRPRGQTAYLLPVSSSTFDLSFLDKLDWTRLSSTHLDTGKPFGNKMSMLRVFFCSESNRKRSTVTECEFF